MVCLTSVLAAAAEEMENNGKNCEDVEAAMRYISFIFQEKDTIARISGRQNEQHTLLDKTAADIV